MSEDKNVKNLMRAFASIDKFLELEDKVRVIRNEMLDLLDEHCEKNNLSIFMKNEMLDKFTSEMKRTLFSQDKVRDSF